MKFKREAWYHYWYGFQARISAITHLLRGHNLQWKHQPFGDAEGECSGDIVCLACPETNSDLGIWCRWRWYRVTPDLTPATPKCSAAIEMDGARKSNESL